ncbi:MAG: type IV pilus assembly protein PilM [Fimbriimonas sp.]|nr:type IV pilus assembly protein PilM [Fimbriimonas sp.]
MAKKLSSVLGIDIGSQKIKVCEIRSQGKEPVITALGIIDTPEGAVDHTGVYNSDAVGSALKQVLSQSGATVSQAVISVAGQASVLVRTLEVPKMNPTELKEHMQWEINRNIPFAESTIVSDFRPLGGDDPNSPNMDVVMAIAPQSAIDTMIACVKKAGRSTNAIDVEPLSMARSIQKSYDDILAGKTVCMVDIGHKTTSINIYHGDRLLMPRQVPVGGEMFTKAIADAFAIGVPDAETMKIDHCDIPEWAGPTTQAIDPFADPGITAGFQAYNPFADDPLPFASPTASPFGETGVDDAPVAPAPEPQAAAPVPADNSQAAQIYNAISPILEEFVSEVRRSIDYYRSRGGDIDAIELCGGGAKLGGLVAYLSKSLGIPCDAYDPLRRLNLNVRKVAPAFVEEHKQEFAVAVGNGLHIFFD